MCAAAWPRLCAGLKGRVVVTCFASNVARVESVALAARDAGRSVALVGRSLRNLDAAARETGYLSDSCRPSSPRTGRMMCPTTTC